MDCQSAFTLARDRDLTLPMLILIVAFQSQRYRTFVPGSLFILSGGHAAGAQSPTNDSKPRAHLRMGPCCFYFPVRSKREVWRRKRFFLFLMGNNGREWAEFLVLLVLLGML